MRKALAIGALVAAGLGVAMVSGRSAPPQDPCAQVVACAMRIDPVSAGPTLAAKHRDGTLAACEQTLRAMRCAPECADGPLPAECRP